MERRPEIQSLIRNPKSKIGFTLVELLVVIGIIVLLVGILLPVVNGVRKSAYAAASAQQISRLTSAIEAYSAEYRAYPGPLSNDQIVSGGSTSAGPLPTGLTGRVTMSENLVLGLIGGLEMTVSTGPPAYNEDRIRSRMGPMSLNPIAPKGGRPYIEVAAGELSLDGTLRDPQKKTFHSDQGGPAADDSLVPEIVDLFPDPLPVIYLRARKGAPGVISDNGKGPGAFQYDLQQYVGYLKPGNPNTGIGGSGPHGLTKLGTEMLITNPAVKQPEAPWGIGGQGTPGYDAVMYFMNPQLTPAAQAKNLTGTPRQKDGYILISPGKDRVYGTRDDITNFGSVQ